MLTKYEKLPFHRRATLWLRHMPLAIAKGLWRLAGWVVAGAPPFRIPADDDQDIPEQVFSRIESARNIWSGATVFAHHRTSNTYSTAEMREMLQP